MRNRVEGCHFLDCFAGSGAVGIEALSRGAEKAVFIELDRIAVRIINENLAHTGLVPRAEVYVSEAVRGIMKLTAKKEQFDLIFLGAPYDSPELEKALLELGSDDLLKKEGTVIAEHRRQHLLAENYGSLVFQRETRYGETVLAFYEKSDLSREL